MSGDYGGGFGGQRGNFNQQGMPMNHMGINNQGPMMNYQQQQMMNQMGGRVSGPMPDMVMQQQQQQQQQQPQPPQPPQLPQQQQHQQQQMIPNPNMVQNNMSLQTPSVPTAPAIPMMEAAGGAGVNVVQSQQPLQTQPAPGNPSHLGQQMTQNQLNVVTLCKFAQETVQEIVCRFQEIFQTLRQSTPPNGTSQGTMEKKVQEQLRSIRLLFKRIRLLYGRCNDGGQISMEYTQVESLIPYKDELDNRPDPPHGEEYKKAVQENRELLDQLSLKNKQLREVIDRLRIVIWEINTMLSMRRS